MQHITVTLSDDLADYAAETAAQQGFASVEAYVSSLLRNAQEIDRFRALIEAGRKGPFRPAEEVMASIRARIGVAP